MRENHLTFPTACDRIKYLVLYWKYFKAIPRNPTQCWPMVRFSTRKMQNSTMSHANKYDIIWLHKTLQTCWKNAAKKNLFLAAYFLNNHDFFMSTENFLWDPRPQYNVDIKNAFAGGESDSPANRRSTLYWGPGDRLEIFSIKKHVVILSHGVGSIFDASGRCFFCMKKTLDKKIYNRTTLNSDSPSKIEQFELCTCQTLT